MSAVVLEFPCEVREDVATARHVLQACKRMGWNELGFSDVLSIVSGARKAPLCDELEDIARRVAGELSIELKPELQP